jgi:hypothetical protein
MSVNYIFIILFYAAIVFATTKLKLYNYVIQVNQALN